MILSEFEVGMIFLLAFGLGAIFQTVVLSAVGLLFKVSAAFMSLVVAALKVRQR